MLEKNAVLEKSYLFSLRMIKLYVHLKKETKIYSLADQVLRSGTSIGANIEEAIGGSSRKDFRARLAIAYREAKETSYWLNLLRDSELLEANLSNSLLKDCQELLRLLTAILKSLQSN